MKVGNRKSYTRLPQEESKTNSEEIKKEKSRIIKAYTEDGFCYGFEAGNIATGVGGITVAVMRAEINNSISRETGKTITGILVPFLLPGMILGLITGGAGAGIGNIVGRVKARKVSKTIDQKP